MSPIVDWVLILCLFWKQDENFPCQVDGIIVHLATPLVITAHRLWKYLDGMVIAILAESPLMKFEITCLDYTWGRISLIWNDNENRTVMIVLNERTNPLSHPPLLWMLPTVYWVSILCWFWKQGDIHSYQVKWITAYLSAPLIVLPCFLRKIDFLFPKLAMVFLAQAASMRFWTCIFQGNGGHFRNKEPWKQQH